jgi:deoxyribodipyrimidine photo-lyase
VRTRFASEFDGHVGLEEHWRSSPLSPTRRNGPQIEWASVRRARVTGFWGMSEGAEAFLDQVIVWRELCYNTCAKRPDDYDRYESLPDWARATLEGHIRDPRPHLYTRRALEEARTHDELWNAAQRQLRREGWYHNYRRTLWGKKILEWSKTPRQALGTMIHIMNRWSLDGRNPNSYGGYLWTLGRYDRPWPARDVYGAVRSMSSERTRAKVSVDAYLERFAYDERTKGMRGRRLSP